MPRGRAAEGASRTGRWISALKALEDGALKTSSEGKQFLAIPRDCFAHVTTAADLAQLYTHRLPGLGRIAALPLR